MPLTLVRGCDFLAVDESNMALSSNSHLEDNMILMMEAASKSRTSVNFYQAAQRSLKTGLYFNSFPALR
jgi:hypothetical protein